jgi:hypothetical protein
MRRTTKVSSDFDFPNGENDARQKHRALFPFSRMAMNAQKKHDEWALRVKLAQVAEQAVSNYIDNNQI